MKYGEQIHYLNYEKDMSRCCYHGNGRKVPIHAILESKLKFLNYIRFC
jgi:hypothetical protein